MATSRTYWDGVRYRKRKARVLSHQPGFTLCWTMTWLPTRPGAKCFLLEMAPRIIGGCRSLLPPSAPPRKFVTKRRHQPPTGTPR